MSVCLLQEGSTVPGDNEDGSGDPLGGDPLSDCRVRNLQIDAGGRGILNAGGRRRPQEDGDGLGPDGPGPAGYRVFVQTTRTPQGPLPPLDPVMPYSMGISEGRR